MPGSNNDAQMDPIEQEAVYDMMRATSNNWATYIPNVCCSRWHGIECMPHKDNIFHVVSLSFGFLLDDIAFPTYDHTRSSISPSITKLPHIRTLFFLPLFHQQSSTHTIFSRPIRLLFANFSSEGKVGMHIGLIPPELGNLTCLAILDLHKNNLNDSISYFLGQIPDLRSLDLSCNKLSGSIPNISFPSLSILNHNQNHLKGPIPTTLLSSTSILKIDLSRNRISELILNLNNLKNLIVLDLSYNTLTGPLPHTLQNLNSIQVLILNGNPFMSATLPNDMFLELNNLIILGLSNTNLEGPIPEYISRTFNHAKSAPS